MSLRRCVVVLMTAALTCGAAALPAASQVSAEPPALRQGMSGPAVLSLQRQLTRLGYWLGPTDGRFGGLTTQAVYALQKAASLGRDGVVGQRTWAALQRGTRPAAATTTGRKVEIDLKRQVLLLVRDGRVEQIFNTSTGNGRLYTVGGVVKRAVTPTGTFRVYRQVNGWDPGPLGTLYRPRYFRGGIAVHGFGSVPPYPASHGCVRVSLRAMDWLWASSWLKVGDAVVVR